MRYSGVEPTVEASSTVSCAVGPGADGAAAAVLFCAHLSRVLSLIVRARARAKEYVRARASSD